mmetsp:Transcript_871/g.1732  ORF Transcript_871/g.1732 Transcript_871/m.1732 type:complete len:192 (+) Transcript_871:123-698(+)
MAPIVEHQEAEFELTAEERDLLEALESDLGVSDKREQRQQVWDGEARSFVNNSNEERKRTMAPGTTIAALESVLEGLMCKPIATTTPSSSSQFFSYATTHLIPATSLEPVKSAQKASLAALRRTSSRLKRFNDMSERKLSGPQGSLLAEQIVELQALIDSIGGIASRVESLHARINAELRRKRELETFPVV